jgi:hypothetical protein
MNKTVERRLEKKDQNTVVDAHDIFDERDLLGLVRIASCHLWLR